MATAYIVYLAAGFEKRNFALLTETWNLPPGQHGRPDRQRLLLPFYVYLVLKFIGHIVAEIFEVPHTSTGYAV